LIVASLSDLFTIGGVVIGKNKGEAKKGGRVPPPAIKKLDFISKGRQKIRWRYED